MSTPERDHLMRNVLALEPPRLRWMAAAACAGRDDVEWFPEPGRGVLLDEVAAPALAVCATCPVVAPCRAYADALRIAEGVWGGETAPARKARHRAERRARRP